MEMKFLRMVLLSDIGIVFLGRPFTEHHFVEHRLPVVAMETEFLRMVLLSDIGWYCSCWGDYVSFLSNVVFFFGHDSHHHFVEHRLV